VYSPYQFQTPWDTFEFGKHILQVDANLVIVSMAWLTSEDQGVFTSQPQEPDLNTLGYWVRRLEPVITTESDDEIIVVFANRCGSEDHAVYAGTSAVIGIKGGEVNVYGLLGRDDKRLLVVDTNQPPFAKLMLTENGIVLKTEPSPSAMEHGAQPIIRSSTADPKRDYERATQPHYIAEEFLGPSPAPTHIAVSEMSVASKRDKTTSPKPAPKPAPPPKLTIPTNASKSWRKAVEAGKDIPTPEGPSPTPGHHRPNIDAVFASANQAQLASRRINSGLGLVFSPVESARQPQEPGHLPGSMRDARHTELRDSGVSGVGRITPIGTEIRASRNSNRRAPGQPQPHMQRGSSQRNTDAIRERQTMRSPSKGDRETMRSPSKGERETMRSLSKGERETMRSPSKGEREMMWSPSRGERDTPLTVDTRRDGRQSRNRNKSEEQPANRFLDSPVFKHPDAGMLSEWLETIPVNPTPGPTPGPAPAPAPVHTLGSGGRTHQHQPSPVKSDKMTDKMTGTTPPSQMCRHCGHSLASDGPSPATEEVKSDVEKELVASIPIKLDEPQKPRPRDQRDEIQRWRQLVQEELQRRREAGEQDTPVNPPLDKLSSTNGTDAASPVASPAAKASPVEDASPVENASLVDKDGDTKMDVNGETGDVPGASAAATASDGSSDMAGINGEQVAAGKKSGVAESSDAEMNGTGKVNLLVRFQVSSPVERADVDPLAPSGSIVPPPIKGMNKVVIVEERPKSLAW